MATTTTDLYGVLGVGRTATADELKKAYRAKARKHHPDQNPGDTTAETRFKEVQAAYDVLSDPAKRTNYDRYGHPDGPQATRSSGAGAGAGGAGFDPSSFSDLFGDLFGRRGRPGGASPGGGPGTAGSGTASMLRGRDIEVEASVSFEQAMNGDRARMPVDHDATCPTCAGSGAKPGTKPRLCPECGGRGMKQRNEGVFAMSVTCPRCGGDGVVIEDPCDTCHGDGRVRDRRTITVQIPAGVKDGTRLRLKGKGEAGPRGGQPGDLYVRFRVAPSDRWQRDGDDLVLEVPITFAEAALGADVEVPTVAGGRVKLKVAPGSQSGKLLRVSGQGAPRLKGATVNGTQTKAQAGDRGDLLVRLRVQVPAKTSKRERELIGQLAAQSKVDPREELFA